MRGPAGPSSSRQRFAETVRREDTRTSNRRLVLQHLFDGEQLSRADLARRTSLTPPTISALIGELTDTGLVTEVGIRKTNSQVGKPPTMLKVKPDARSIIAVDLSDTEVGRAAVLDMAGTIHTRIELPANEVRGDEALEWVVRLTKLAIQKASSPILGLGIGTPGVVSDGGHIVESTNLGWQDLAFGHYIETELGYPATIGNDANAAALAEYRYSDHESTNLAVIKIGSGVGAGFVLDGKLFRPKHASTGEIGHLVTDPAGPKCRCGHNGCLETFVAIRPLQAAIKAGADPVAVARKGAEHLGVAMAAVVAILDIDEIVVSGPKEQLGADFCDITATALKARCLQATTGPVRIRYTNLGAEAVLLGAAGLVISKELGVA